MFRTPQFLKRSEDILIECQKQLVDPGNDQTQEKSGYNFVMEDKNHFYDWYRAYFLVHFKFEAKVNGGNIVADTESAPINGSFSLIKNMRVSSSRQHFLSLTISTKAFSLKICLTIQTIIRELWQKINFGILTLTKPQYWNA